jgi:hypothetical protein
MNYKFTHIFLKNKVTLPQYLHIAVTAITTIHLGKSGSKLGSQWELSTGKMNSVVV